MSQFITVAQVGEIPDGGALVAEVAGRRVAVFNLQGEYRAIDDTCPHAAGSLAQGELDAAGIVTCPDHGWRFDTADGTWRDYPKLKIDHYQTRVVNGEVQVRVPDEPAPE